MGKQTSASNSKDSVTWEFREFADCEEAGSSANYSRNEGAKLRLRTGTKLLGRVCKKLLCLTATYLWKALKSKNEENPK